MASNKYLCTKELGYYQVGLVYEDINLIVAEDQINTMLPPQDPKDEISLREFKDHFQLIRDR